MTTAARVAAIRDEVRLFVDDQGRYCATINRADYEWLMQMAVANESPMASSDHDAVVVLARQARLPRTMYDSKSKREALNRLLDIVTPPSRLRVVGESKDGE